MYSLYNDGDIALTKEKTMKKLFRPLIAALCVLALSVTGVSALSVEEAVELLEESYVDELPAAAYDATTLKELFDAVGDPYTYYMSEEEFAAFNASVESENTVTGIGAAIEYTDEGILISSVLAGGGALDAGIKPGDLIVAVEGASCVPAGEQFRPLIVGDEGSFVSLTVKHPDGTTEDYRIERRAIEIHNTTVTAENGVATIDCDSFGSQTADYFHDGIEENDENADLWVVDLRSNAGGLANAAASALGYFTGPGPKLYYRERGGGYFYSLHLESAMTKKPVIVLVDEYSASASEVFAGGIRASKAGIVVGSRTYGKGTAQIVYSKENLPDLFDGDDAVKVTAYRFYCSDGNTTDRLGVIPTLRVDAGDAAGIIDLLSAVKPEAGEYLQLKLNGVDFYIEEPETLSKSASAGALTALLSALPPDARLVRCWDGGAAGTSPSEALEQYGDASARRGFSDVADSPYAAEINTLAVYDILLGGDDGAFRPNNTMTRAELCAMLAQALDITSAASAGFSDVAEESWYAGDVNAVSLLGLVQGDGAGRFNPSSMLTQEEFIAVMGRLVAFLNLHAADYISELEEDLSQFEELVPFAEWARDGAAVLTDFSRAYDGTEGRVMLYGALEKIDPHAAVTREQAAASLCRTLEVLRHIAY